MRSMLSLSALAALLLVHSAPAAELKIDPTASKLEFVGSKPEGSHTGGFKSFSGKVTMPGDDFAKATVSVEILTDSLFSDDPKLTQHLKSADFFSVREFPKATFTSTAIAPSKKPGATHEITGNLTLHGVTKPVTVPVTVNADAGGVKIQGNFTLHREDFGMTYGKGKIHNEVKVTLSLKAAR
jgi:polyisoprenoid-binding protein YceI